MDEIPEKTRLDRLKRSLAGRLGFPVDVTPYRSGVDCWVDVVRRPGAPDAVVRSARFERLQTRYEGLVDFGVVVEKEVVVARLLRDAGVPTPAVLAWHRTADPDLEPSWMLAELVPHASSEEVPPGAQTEIGRLARRIHAIEPSGSDLVHLAPSAPWDEWILRRILQRLDAAGRYMPLPAAPSVERALSDALDARRGAHSRSLLHLDLRGPNLAMDGDRILAVFDLANSIVGDRYLELGRIRGCGLLTPAFLAGYGDDPVALERSAAALDAYELDLAALLVVVSREEIDDDLLHRRMVKRVTALLARLTTGESGARGAAEAAERGSPFRGE